VSPSDFDFNRLTRQQASRYLRRRWKLRLTAGTLATYGSRGVGPSYDLQEGRTLYTPADLDAWAQRQRGNAGKGNPVNKKSNKKRKKPPSLPKPKKGQRALATSPSSAAPAKPIQDDSGDAPVPKSSWRPRSSRRSTRRSGASL
jgi:hypothetical protein